MTEDEFIRFFEDAAADAKKIAQADVAFSLPEAIRFHFELGDYARRESTMEEITSRLFQGGRFPRIIDVGVEGVAQGCTIIWVCPSGHEYVTELEERPVEEHRFGPFQAVGLVLPYLISLRARPLQRADMEEAAPKWAKEPRGASRDA